MRRLWILLFHPCSTRKRHWRALECKGKAEGAEGHRQRENKAAAFGGLSGAAD